jgi:histidyl-tRNA synthetase
MRDSVIAILDKLDKISWAEVSQQLTTLGLSANQVEELDRQINKVNYLAGNDSLDEQTAQELNILINAKEKFENLDFQVSLMRGLDYYTGTIWEVRANDVQIGSLGGGGRYDNLTEMFGGQNMSGVGISFGIERIYDVMEELKLFPETIAHGVKVLFVPRDAGMEEFAFEQVQAIRDAGISAELFLGNVKKQKQFKYVEDKNIACIVEVGENEKQSGKFRLRNAKTRDTLNDLSLAQIIEELLKEA